MSKDGQSHRATKMMKRLGMMPPVLVKPSQQKPAAMKSSEQKPVAVKSSEQPATVKSSEQKPAAAASTNAGGTADELSEHDGDASSVSSFTPSELELLHSDYVTEYVRKLPNQVSPHEEHRPQNHRKRKLIPESTSTFRAEFSSPVVSCSLTINSGASPTTSPVVMEFEAKVAHPKNSVDPKVIRDLFAARDKILAQREQEQQRSDSEDDNQTDTDYEPLNENSSDSGSDHEELHENSGANPTTSPGLRHENQEDLPIASSGSDHEDEDEPQEVDGDGNDLRADEEHESPPRRKRFKRRIRQTTSSSRRERQRARNCGEAYTTSTGKEVPEKQTQQLPEVCRKKCSSRLTPESCSELCKDYWNLGKLDRRSIYMANLIEIAPKSSQKLNSNVSPSRKKNRQKTMKYHVVLNGENVDVCKGCFLKIFNGSAKYLEGIVKHKMSSTAGTLPNEQRGKNNATAISEERLRCVVDHLNSFPKYVSHYARNKTDKCFLNSNLTMKSMYEAYVDQCPDKPVSRWIYDQEFHRLNLRIKPLRADTCNKCDTLETAFLYARTEQAKATAKMNQELHHRKAEKAKKQKTDDIESLKKKPQSRVISFDLQQCLPTPHLQTSVVFYRRQLWVYNLTIHDCGSGKSWHNMWHEGEAERGPNEIGSALYNYLMNLPDEVEEVVLWSDTCGGQNKNSIICAVLQTVLQNKKTLNIIDQKFLVSGHTFMDCDTDHSVIEGKKRKALGIHLPRDWYSLVRNASKNFTVQLMDQTLQLDFKSLLKGRESPLVKRKKNTDKDKFVWKDVVWLRHSRKLPPGTLSYKATHEREAPFLHLDLKRKKKCRLELKPTLTYDGPRPIKQKKKDDLMELLHLIDPECRPFYIGLRGDGESDDSPMFDPDLLPTTDEEESGEE